MTGAPVIRVVPVRGRALARQFVDLPFRLYRDDPLWVPPLRSDVLKMISPKHNPFFKEAVIENFLALDASGRAIGRISASIHAEYNRLHGHGNAFFGMLEMEDDPAVAAALLGRVEAWAAERGKHTLTGPYSYTSTQDAALLLENIDGKPPSLLQTYNPPYYRSLLEGCGYTLAFTFSTYGIDLAASPATERALALVERVRARHNITVRSATPRDLKENLDEIRRMFNDSFAANYEIAPISAPVFGFTVDSVRPFVDLDGIRVIEVDGVPRAFFLIVPDLNEVLAKLKGRLGLADLLRLGKYRREVRNGVVALLGSDPESQGKGLGRVLIAEIRRYGESRYGVLHTMWIDDRNPSSYVLAENAGCTRTKRYGVFRKLLPARLQAVPGGTQEESLSVSAQPMKTNDPIIQIRALHKHYQAGDSKVPVLRDINLRIARGSMAVIRGMSGSGKTTLLNILGGLDTIDSGEVEVAGHALHRLSFRDLTRYRAEQVGFIFQFHNLIPTLTVLENVLSGLEAMRPLVAADEAQARFYLGAVGLGGLEDKFPARLSGGQQQRVAIARALIKEPALILADEPTGSLDEESGQVVIDVLRRLQAEKGVTVVIVTHNPEWGQYADTVHEMRAGQLHQLAASAPAVAV